MLFTLPLGVVCCQCADDVDVHALVQVIPSVIDLAEAVFVDLSPGAGRATTSLEPLLFLFSSNLFLN